MILLKAVTAIAVISALVFAYLWVRFVAECNKFRLNLQPNTAAALKDDEGYIKCTIIGVRGEDVTVRTRAGNIYTIKRDRIYPPIR